MQVSQLETQDSELNETRSGLDDCKENMHVENVGKHD